MTLIIDNNFLTSLLFVKIRIFTDIDRSQRCKLQADRKVGLLCQKTIINLFLFLKRLCNCIVYYKQSKLQIHWVKLIQFPTTKKSVNPPRSIYPQTTAVPLPFSPRNVQVSHPNTHLPIARTSEPAAFFIIPHVRAAPKNP